MNSDESSTTDGPSGPTHLATSDIRDEAAILMTNEYEMKNSTRGLFVIFNHEYFAEMTDAKGKRIKPARRHGTELDKAALEGTFRKLGFDVEPWDNLTKDEIAKKMQEYAKVSHKNYDCFGCAILTHGEENDRICAKDAIYHLKDLTDPIKTCQTLIGKPKLFFVQACKGKLDDTGHIKTDTIPDKDGEDDAEDVTDDVVIPVEADFLISYSTTEGYKARRNTKEGSWYVQVLADFMLQYRNMELLQILTLVNREVCRNRGTVTSDNMRRRQAPTIVSRLTGFVHFPSDGSLYEPKAISDRSVSTLPTESSRVELHRFKQMEEKVIKMEDAMKAITLEFAEMKKKNGNEKK